MATKSKPYSEIATMPVNAIRFCDSKRAWGDLYNEFLLRLEKTPATEALYVVFEDEQLLKSVRHAFAGYMKRDGLTPEEVIFRTGRYNGQRVLTARRGPKYNGSKSK